MYERGTIVRTAVSYWQKKVLILPLLDALSPITGGVGGGLTLRTTSNKKLLVLQKNQPQGTDTQIHNELLPLK